MNIRKYLLVLASVSLIAGCGGSDDDPIDESAGTIDTVAQEQGFTALLAAVEKAELGATLSDPNAEVTVFAPTDDAFNTLATNLGFADATVMVEALPADALRNILTYHALPAARSAEELSEAANASQATLYSFENQPSTLALESEDGVRITDAALTTATVTSADIGASNGVIHAIDKVMVPPGVLNIVQMAQVNPQLSSLVSAVVSADLQEALTVAGPLTVFAPTNDAFAAAPSGLTEDQLRTVLTYHAVPSRVLAADIPFGTPVPTVALQTITINEGTPPTITDTTSAAARITATDVRASNGVIHVIDKVLIPAL